MTWINVSDEDNQAIYDHYNVRATPEIMLLNPNRTIIGKHLAVSEDSVALMTHARKLKHQEISAQKVLLEQQNRKLEELDRMKSHFFANISHEFRTPLTIIEGAVHEIRRSGAPAEKDLEVIARNNNNLLQLVNQILDLRKLEAGKMKLDLVQGDVISYLNYLLESFQTLAASQNKNLHFIHHEPSLVMDFDPEKLQQVVSNLLSNAVKYTPKGPDIYVIVQRKSGDEEQLQLTVKDSGIGIPEICKAIGMSRSQLHLKIKALTNRSTSHYIRGFRLMRARKMFHTTDRNVTEVAFEVGFRDVAYFSRSFSAEFGLSPREYLKTMQG